MSVVIAPVPPTTPREREDAAYSYLISVVIAVAGSPFPVLNLLGCWLFFLMVKKRTYFVRYHAWQAFLSQLITSGLSAVFIGWTYGVLFGGVNLSAAYLAFGVVAVLVIVADTILSVWAGLQAKRGKLFELEFMGYLAHAILYRQLQRAEALPPSQQPLAQPPASRQNQDPLAP